MLTLTRKADYALVAMADLARRDPHLASAREIACSVRIPLPVLTNILHQLLHHGLVSSTMGSKGGYCLARPAEEITLAEMIDAIEGQFRLAVCCGDSPADETDAEANRCDLEGGCRIRTPMQRVHSSLRTFMSRVTLADLAFDRVPVSLGFDVAVGGHGSQCQKDGTTASPRISPPATGLKLTS